MVFGGGVRFWRASSTAVLHRSFLAASPSISRAASPKGPKRAKPPTALPMVSAALLASMASEGSARVPPSLNGLARFPRLKLIFPTESEPTPFLGMGSREMSSFSDFRLMLPLPSARREGVSRTRTRASAIPSVISNRVTRQLIFVSFFEWSPGASSLKRPDWRSPPTTASRRLGNGRFP